jgi:hypothetical protein
MIKKDHYTKKFLELKKTDTEYDFSKIKYLIDYGVVFKGRLTNGANRPSLDYIQS